MIERQDFYTEDEYTYALEQGIEFEREESMRKSLMEDMEDIHEIN